MNPSSRPMTPDLAGKGEHPGEERRHAFILATFHVIAEKGVEGLRIRDVAARAGVNVATLYYYYPTKEGLIQGVVDHIVQHIVTVHITPVSSETFTAQDALFQHFDDLCYQIREMPEIFHVMSELLLRASRDTTIFPMLKQTDENWQQYLITLLEEGIQQGAFRAELNVRSTAQTLMAFFKGMTLQLTLQEQDLALDIQQLKQWLLR